MPAVRILDPFQGRGEILCGYNVHYASRITRVTPKIPLAEKPRFV
jgi:hypothetical protein